MYIFQSCICLYTHHDIDKDCMLNYVVLSPRLLLQIYENMNNSQKNVTQINVDINFTEL